MDELMVERELVAGLLRLSASEEAGVSPSVLAARRDRHREYVVEQKEAAK